MPKAHPLLIPDPAAGYSSQDAMSYGWTNSSSTFDYQPSYSMIFDLAEVINLTGRAPRPEFGSQQAGQPWRPSRSPYA